MNSETQSNKFDRIVKILTGLAMFIYPLAQAIAFAIHPQFLTFKRETGALIQYDYIQNWGWQTGHTLVYATLPLGILVWAQLARLVGKSRPWLALVGILASWLGLGYTIGNFGSVMAEGTIGLMLPKEVALPAIQLFLDNAGMMKLTFIGQIVGLFGPIILLLALTISPKLKLAPRWSGPLALLGNLIIIVFIDIDGFMIWGALAIWVALMPMALKFLKGQTPGQEPV